MPETCGGRRRKTRGIGELKKGELHGYHAKNSKTARRSALRKTVRSVGPLSTFRKLNAIAVYTKYSSPGKSKTIKTDRNWVKKTYMGGAWLNHCLRDNHLTNDQAKQKAIKMHPKELVLAAKDGKQCIYTAKKEKDRWKITISTELFKT
jgi:hypothetical protein